MNGKNGLVVQEKEDEKFAVKLEEGTEVVLKAANLVLDEQEAESKQSNPKAKRARFADDPSEITTVEQKRKSLKSAMTEEVDEIEISDDDEEEERDDPPYSTWANKVITIRFIRNKKDSGICFNLKNGYTHQVVQRDSQSIFAPYALIVANDQVFYQEKKSGGDEVDKLHEELIIGYGNHSYLLLLVVTTFSVSHGQLTMCLQKDHA